MKFPVHRDWSSTHENRTDHYVGKAMKVVIHSICDACLHGLFNSYEGVSHPLRYAVELKSPKTILISSFCSRMKAITTTCVLALRENAASFIWLEVCSKPAAGHTFDALNSWLSSFWVVPTWTPDRDSHFTTFYGKSEPPPRLSPLLLLLVSSNCTAKDVIKRRYFLYIGYEEEWV